MWGLDSRLKENEQKTDKLFKIIQTKENIELGLTRISDTTYKTNVGNPTGSTSNHLQPNRNNGMQFPPIHFQGETQTNYNYTPIQPDTINSSEH